MSKLEEKSGVYVLAKELFDKLSDAAADMEETPTPARVFMYAIFGFGVITVLLMALV